jgi:alkaline phosphatase
MQLPTPPVRAALAAGAVVVAGLGVGLPALAASPPSAPAAAERAHAQRDHDRGRRERARNVVLFVGDGMGGAHRTAIRYYAVGPRGQLAMDRLPEGALVRTDPEDPRTLVTDSAASATAYATGEKTYNGAVGVDAQGNPLPTILEQARRAGKSTGLVTTSQVTDATPAAFGAHVRSRSDQSEIARQYLVHSRPDVILGGGEDWWYPAGAPGAFPDNPREDPSEQSRGTKGNLVAQAEQLGYDYVTSARELRAARGRRVLGLFANEEMFQQRPEGQGDVYQPRVSLPEMTDQALDRLSRNRRGFFLMVEEEAIDEMSHEDNGRLMLRAGQALDRAVDVAREFARTHPDTLVIVGADHECGGLTVEDTGASDESGDGISREDGPFPAAGTDKRFVLDWTTTGHTAADVPFTSEGPGAGELSGTIDNTDVYGAMADAMRLRRTPDPAPPAR